MANADFFTSPVRAFVRSYRIDGKIEPLTDCPCAPCDTKGGECCEGYAGCGSIKDGNVTICCKSECYKKFPHSAIVGLFVDFEGSS